MSKKTTKDSQVAYYSTVMLPILQDYWQTVEDTPYLDYPPAIPAGNIGAICFARIHVKDKDIKPGNSLISVLKKNGDRIPNTPLHHYPIIQIREFIKFIESKIG